MLLSAIALFCCTAFPAALPASNSAAAVAEKSADARPEEKAHSSLPDAPSPKSEVLANGAESSSAAESITPGAQPFITSPTKPAAIGSYETVRQRKIWYGLVAAGHGAAVLDAWTTRRAISGGYGAEGDPFMRPFAHSGALYAATQVSPAVMDYLGHRMMTSNHLLLRRFWWIPQTAGAGFSLGAGIHNYRLVP